jgi:4-amino-4-deoxy-L-arabinose transferase-like glycosyltransferase
MLAKRVWLLLFIAIVGFYLYGLGQMPLVGPDEPRYAQVAREMFLRRDLITPTLGGHTWFEKPVLLYWLMMGGYKVFGVSEWSARVGPALCGVLTVLAVWWISRLLEMKASRAKFSFLCTLVIASCGGVIVFSRGASFDIVVTATLTWALSFFLAYAVDSRRQHWYLAGFYCFIGLSLLGKGLIGVVLPFGIITSYYLVRWRWPDRRLLLSLVWGIPLVLVVAATWYAPVIARHGWPFIDEFFIQHHFARYFSNKYQHPQPFYYYLPIILMLSIPWTVFLIESLIKAREWQRTGEDGLNKARIFAIVWLMVPILFFSLSGSKLPAYVLPSLPAAALLIGERLWTVLSKESAGNAALKITAALCLVLSAGAFVYVQRTQITSVRCAALILAPVALMTIFILVRNGNRLLRIVLLALLPVTVSIGVLNFAVSGIASRQSVRDLIARANREGYSGAPLVMFSRIERSSEFYAAGRVVYGRDGDPLKVENPEEVITQVRNANGQLLLIVPLGSLSILERIPEVQIRLLADNGRNGIVVATERR